MTVLAEECAEVGQVACKAIRFGLKDFKPGQKDDNHRMLERELGDLMAVVKLLGLNVWQEDIDAKLTKLEKYMGISIKLGTLEDA